MPSEYSINESLKSQIKNLPNSSGIYMMLDKNGIVIYIGKALNLKSRVRSYFNEKSWSERPKLHFMMPKVKEIKTFITYSEKEALILEASLVNEHQPKYNVTLKDDKKFPWLMITYDEKYPRLVPIRDIRFYKSKKTKNKFFGPYSDATAMWEIYRLIKEVFKLRLRRKPLFKDRPCMNYHLELCSGPCQKLVSDEDYTHIVNQVEDFLLGKYGSILKELKEQMKFYSSNLEFEKAAKIRDIIDKINKVLEKQIIVSDDIKLSQDVFACDFNEKNMVIEVLNIREGKVIALKTLNVILPKETIIHEAFNDAIKLYYTKIPNESLPNEIVCEYELIEKEEIEKWLSVSIVTPKKGRKFELVKLAKQNARLSLEKILYLNPTVQAVDKKHLLENLQKALSLKNPPHRIECFDISHLGGTNTVASMVVFIDGEPDKSQYRKFKIKSLPVGKIDDFSSMREVISRRYRRGRIGDMINHVPNCDLIIIDGGKGQLSAACEALEKNGVDLKHVDIVSLAKKREELFKPGLDKPIILDRKSDVLFLVQRIRDEAHRFAITFQREKRKDVFQDHNL